VPSGAPVTTPTVYGDLFIANGGFYIAMGDALVCIDRQSGRERWDVRLSGDLRRSGGALAPPPAAAGQHLVVATLSGEVLIVSPSNGDVTRRLRVGSPMRSQPSVDRGWIYVGTTDGQLVGLDTGDESLTGWPTWAGNPARTGARQVGSRGCTQSRWSPQRCRDSAPLRPVAGRRWIDDHGAAGRADRRSLRR